MGTLIGQPIKEIMLEHDKFDNKTLRIRSLVVHDPETGERCEFVAEVDIYGFPYIKLRRNPELEVKK